MLQGGNLGSGFHARRFAVIRHNTFMGASAGQLNTLGQGNNFYGYNAGYNNTTGSSNIYIANQGPDSGNENNTIRIGTQGTRLWQQNVTYIAGIYPTFPF
jgi:hypothetical protein